MSAAVDTAARARLRVGSVLKDKWTLDRLLGVGGMAAVYAATHRNNKRVALKVLLPELANDAEIRARFVREGYAANTIGHPGAVSVLDDDVSEDGAPFLVMELLEGETVEARWERKGHALDLGEVLIIADQLLDVLAAAHKKGIVHRDIKPENLFLTREGKLKILDFGIARVLEVTRSKLETRAGYVMGTPAFMAPEQAMGKWDEVDGRSDIWSVGATMFTLVTGQHVHEAGSGNEQLIRTATQPARPVGSIHKTMAPSVSAVIDRALAFDRDVRWPDARTMQEAVRAAYHALKGRAPEDAAARVSLPSAGHLSAAARTAPTMLAEGPPPSGVSSRQGTSAGGFAPSSSTSIGDGVAGTPSVIASRQAERDAAAAEAARAQPVMAEISQRLALARKKVSQADDALTAARKERAAEDDRFHRATSTRMEGVGEARRDFRRTMTAFASMAFADTATFTGAELESLRARAVETRAAADARAKELRVHEAAIVSYDARAVRTGILLVAALVLLVLLLFFSPMILRGLTDDAGTLGP